MIHPLSPFSFLYRCATDVRNWMFDRAWLKERTFCVPTICVGNLSVGGTGKTPHTEWIVNQLLQQGRRVAILSRGYGRKTRGYREAVKGCTANEIGDEPLQMFLHFEEKVVVAVCENRCNGIEELTKKYPDLEAIVLDDAFQHRYVKPTLRILLTDYARPFYDDRLLPAGRLRESAKGAERADAIIVTKCPTAMNANERKAIVDKIAALPHQRVFFTTVKYAELPMNAAKNALVVTGIARPEPLVEHIRTLMHDSQFTCDENRSVNDERIAENGAVTAHSDVRHMRFADHHHFSTADLAAIDRSAETADIVVTTSKDYARLRNEKLASCTAAKMVVQEIEPLILFNQAEELKRIISEHIIKY